MGRLPPWGLELLAQAPGPPRGRMLAELTPAGLIPAGRELAGPGQARLLEPPVLAPMQACSLQRVKRPGLLRGM
jgi:hypothetical protein